MRYYDITEKRISGYKEYLVIEIPGIKIYYKQREFSACSHVKTRLIHTFNFFFHSNLKKISSELHFYKKKKVRYYYFLHSKFV